MRYHDEASPQLSVTRTINSVRISSVSRGSLTDIRCFERRTVRSQEKGKVIQKQHAGLGERFDIASVRPAKTV